MQSPLAGMAHLPVVDLFLQEQPQDLPRNNQTLRIFLVDANPATPTSKVRPKKVAMSAQADQGVRGRRRWRRDQ